MEYIVIYSSLFASAVSQMYIWRIGYDIIFLTCGFWHDVCLVVVKDRSLID
jgi:hypothetical protein